MSPSRVLSRYAPLVAVLAVQAMLVLGAPTASTTVSNAAGGPTGAGAVGPNGATPNGGVPGAPGTVSGPGGTAVGSASGGAGAPGSNGTGSTVAVNGPKDLSHCDRNGK